MDKPDRANYPDAAEWRKVRKAYAEWRMASDLPNHIRSERSPYRVKRIPGPERIVQKTVEVPVENTERLTNLEKALREAQAKVAVRDETPVPESLQDLIDPSLTPREQHDRLIVKFRDAKNLEEMARANGDKSEMMIQLTKAQRLESGIAWNRARLTEQI